MAQGKVKAVTDFLGKCLRDDGLRISRIILFGSHARGKTTDESDMDIVIVSKDFERKNIFERARITKDAEVRTIKKFMVPLDIITLTPAELNSQTSLISEYARKGRVMYAA